MTPRVLGILNVTPDSFSDGGCFVAVEDAVVHAQSMLAAGADMVDVGGESTRPGAEPVDVDTELRRVVPVIEALEGRCRISVDTRRAEVARAAVAAGASIINDVGANLGSVAAELGTGWIGTHVRGEPATMQRDPHYDDVVAEVCEFLTSVATAARTAGVEEIWIDPGFGFGKTLDHNLAVLANLDRLVATGWPVAVGTSRKAMLGTLLARSDGSDEPVPVDDRLIGSVTTATYAMVCGAALIRVHDVAAAKQAATVIAGDKHPRST
ncbi:MAG: dihydropteroate synthase [Acidimicrobiia bacterium]|nr:dihydropteroate synthase [Acidimicrobiia bacterium]